jgi:ADP-ribosylglycohydrolase
MNDETRVLTDPDESIPLQSRFRGCLLGGAVGDALGASVEFLSLEGIRRCHGPRGIEDYDDAMRGSLRYENQENPLWMAADFGAITHGHVSGYLSAGCLAAIIYRIAKGCMLTDAVHRTYRNMAELREGYECAEGLDRACVAAEDCEPVAETVESLGQGWTGEEALSIAVYCALACPDDFAAGVRLAANHGGDSDSTAAITGNILGAWLGVEAIPRHWLTELELEPLIRRTADDLWQCRGDGPHWIERYPPN